MGGEIRTLKTDLQASAREKEMGAQSFSCKSRRFCGSPNILFCFGANIRKEYAASAPMLARSEKTRPGKSAGALVRFM